MSTVTSCPREASSAESAPATSPSPPTLTSGAISAATTPILMRARAAAGDSRLIDLQPGRACRERVVAGAVARHGHELGTPHADLPKSPREMVAPGAKSVNARRPRRASERAVALEAQRETHGLDVA